MARASAWYAQKMIKIRKDNVRRNAERMTCEVIAAGFRRGEIRSASDEEVKLKNLLEELCS